MAEPAQTPDYAVPALDKALDILELLAERGGGLSQLDIATAIERSPGQIFRVLATLERRGYLLRDRRSGLYELSLRLFDLAHRQEPLHALETAGLPVMRALSDTVRQSCNLSVLDAERVRVVAQVESPADFGFRVRVGALFEIGPTATGLVLAAFDPRAAELAARNDVDPTLLERIRDDVHLVRSDAVQPSITDVVVPVLRGDGTALAALTVPYVATSLSASGAGDVLAAAHAAAEEIAADLVL